MKQTPLLRGKSLRSLLIAAALQALLFASDFLSFEAGLLINSHHDDRVCSLYLGEALRLLYSRHSEDPVILRQRRS